QVWNPVEPDLKYSTSRAGLLGASFFLTPNLKTCRMALTRALADSGVSILRSRRTSTASAVIRESGKSRKNLEETGVIGSSTSLRGFADGRAEFGRQGACIRRIPQSSGYTASATYRKQFPWLWLAWPRPCGSKCGCCRAGHGLRYSRAGVFWAWLPMLKPSYSRRPVFGFVVVFVR